MVLPLVKPYIKSDTGRARGRHRRHLHPDAHHRVDHHGEDLGSDPRFPHRARSTAPGASCSAPPAAPDLRHRLDFPRWLLQGKNPEWAVTSRTRPMLENTGNNLIAMLPDNPEGLLRQIRKPGGDPAETRRPDRHRPERTRRAHRPPQRRRRAAAWVRLRRPQRPQRPARTLADGGSAYITRL
jgi:hypothetical protein